MIECDNNEEFIIANLSSAVFNETLDLAFNEGEKICSMLEGSDSEMESEEEEAGERIKEVIEKS